MRGTFHEDLSSVELDFDIEVRLKNGQSAKIIAVRDDLCGWVDLKQSDRSDCPPRKGAATLSASMSLARGFIMEVMHPHCLCDASPLGINRGAVGYVLA